MPRTLNTIAAKLLLAFLAMCAIIALQGLYGYRVLNQAGDMVVGTFDGPLMAVNYARAANLDFSQIERRLLQRSVATKRRRPALDAEIDSLTSVFDDDLSVAQERSSETDELTQIHRIKRLMSQWAVARKNSDIARMLSLSGEIDQAFDLLIEYNTDHSFVGRRGAVDAIARFRYVLAGGVGIGLLIATVIATMLARGIVRPLSQAASAARNIAAGQFEAPIPEGGEDETGVLLRSMTVMQDSIREMVARETARAASAEVRLADALETSDEGVILVTAGGHIAIANSRMRSYFSVLSDELVPGAPYQQVRIRMFALFTNVDGDEVVADEHRLPDGRWLRLTTSPTTDGGSIVFASEFTDIKEREESYRIAKHQAEAANAAKSRFLANMSHELRTPLNAIIGFSEIITAQLFGPIANVRYVDYATDILRSGRHLLDVINGVLDLSKSDAGKLTLHAEGVDLAYVLKDCAKMVVDQCVKAKIVFTTAGLNQALPVSGEKAKLRQIFLNLLSNAIKFTEEGGRVALQAAYEGDDIVVSVVDTGIGMSPDEIEVALTAFGQVDNRLERKYEGTGLGLPLAVSLVELHAGDLTIDSYPGRGTTIKVAFARSNSASAGASSQVQRV
jgi:signal transduction histidine kinase/HAMP domain-containing protein